MTDDPGGGPQSAEPTRLAERLVSLARRLEADGVYNGGKYLRAAAERELVRAAVQPGLADRASLEAELARLVADLTGRGYPTAFFEVMALATDALRTGRPLGIDMAPEVRTCRTCGELFVGPPPAACPACEAPALTFREQPPTWYFEPMSSAAALEALRPGPARLASLVAGRTDGDLVRPPRAGEWSAAETLAHLVGTEELLATRINRLLTEDEPDLAAAAVTELTGEPAPTDWPESDEAALPSGPPGATARELAARYAAVRGATIIRLEPLDHVAWERTGRHAEFGIVSVRSQAAYFARHEASHLAQLAAALDGRVPGERRATGEPSAGGSAGEGA